MSMPARSPAEVALSLAEALVLSSNVPLLLLDGDLNIVATSASFIQTFEMVSIPAPGGGLAEFSRGEWNSPRLRSLLKATANGQAAISAYEMDLVRAGRPDRKLVLNAQKLDYGDDADVRVLLTIADVTDARLAEKLKDDLLREKAILLQELQHRVANSLQIIASVLMLSARRVNSDETRRHLYDAHNRVMSVATLQKRLSVSTVGSVLLGSYFTDLCESIAASMIADPEQLVLTVQCDESVAEAEVSVSLGLIVTELVINALKHAFPGGRRGTISVDYRSDPSGWTLKVQDDGVGMPSHDAHSKRGLGSSIVTALARQLNAQVEIADGQPGTQVRIIHAEVSAGTESELVAAI
jgi:two-component sensor histidine kinase